MADQNNNNSDLENYLAGKSALSRVYQQTSADGPSIATDNAILNAAKQSVASESKTSSSKVYRWYVPMALAASVLVTVIVLRLLQTEAPIPEEQIAESLDDSEAETYVGSSQASPQRMLEKIVLQVQNNQLEEARQQLDIFKEIFPDYKIDYEKYPELKQLQDD